MFRNVSNGRLLEMLGENRRGGASGKGTGDSSARRDRKIDSFAPSKFLSASPNPAGRRIQRKTASAPSIFAPLSPPSDEIKPPLRATSRENLSVLSAVRAFVLRRRHFCARRNFLPASLNTARKRIQRKRRARAKDSATSRHARSFFAKNSARAHQSSPERTHRKRNPRPPCPPAVPSLRFRLRAFTIPARKRGARAADQTRCARASAL